MVAMEWRTTAFGVFLVAMLLSLQLIAAPQAMAVSTNNSSVTFRRTVIAWYDEMGQLQLNVTWINQTIDFANLTSTSCPCHNSSSCNASNLTSNLNVSVVTLYNMSEEHEQLLFFGITIYNETFNYTMYTLVYNAERSQYNFTLITRIFTDPETGENLVFATAINIAPREDRALSVGDTIVTKDNLTLSDYYWTLNKVLMKLRRSDETSWIWGRSAYELRHLSHLVRLKLPEYNQEKAVGSMVIVDGAADCVFCMAQIVTTYYSLPFCATCLSCAAACATIFTVWWCIGCIAVPCSVCIITLSAHVYSCCMCAEYMGWIDCPMG